MSEPQRDVQDIAETSTARMLRQIAAKRFLSPMDVPLLEDAADMLDLLSEQVARLKADAPRVTWEGRTK